MSIFNFTKPEWMLTELIPIPNTYSDHEMAHRIEAILRDSDYEFKVELSKYYVRNGIQETLCVFTAEQYIEIFEYLSSHPVRKGLYMWLTRYYEMKNTSFMLMNKDAVCTGLNPVLSGKNILDDINEIRKLFFDENAPLPELDANDPIDAITMAFAKDALVNHATKNFSCGCGIAWNSIMYGNECIECGEKRPVPPEAGIQV